MPQQHSNMDLCVDKLKCKTINPNEVLSMGPNTHPVPLELFATNRRRLAEAVLKSSNEDKAVILLQGGDEVPFYDTDITINTFRQESYFMWAFGVLEPGCYGLIEVGTKQSHLFVPRYPQEYAVWMGNIKPLQHFKDKYKTDHVHYADEVATVLQGLNVSKILTLTGKNTDSDLIAKPATFEGIEKFNNIDNTTLFPIIAELRVIKTCLELQVLNYVANLSSAAHRKVMRFAKTAEKEYQCESVFLDHTYRVGGCRHVSYTCICGSGPNGAILHYGHGAEPNDRVLKDGDMLLFDMGANYFGYAADITCSFPRNGKFTDDQKMIYEAVLDANRAVHKSAKPGVSWVKMHELALLTMFESLVKGGVLQGNPKDMIEAGLGAIFQPHGLGHLLGLDVHDVGGYLAGQPERPSDPTFSKLRTARILQSGMVLTIEPGCYFIDFLLDKALADAQLSKFLVPDVLKRFRGFGGVRIEDDIVITTSGVVDLTKVPRTVKEIEDWMAGKDDEKY